MTTNGTPFSDIYDLFLMTITDYRLTSLFEESIVDFETFLEAWLRFSISDFTICDQSLVYTESTKLFTATLTDKNQIVLAKLMMMYWLKKEVADVTQFRLHVTDRDFKVPSEAQNLKEKQAYLITIKEECSQMLNDYGYKAADWTSWYNQDFSGI